MKHGYERPLGRVPNSIRGESVFIRGLPSTFEISVREPLAFEGLAVEFLRDRGWVVQKPYEWETPPEICRRLGITWKILSARLASPIRPHVEVARGKRRLAYVASNSLFDAFCIGTGKMNQEKAGKTGKEIHE